MADAAMFSVASKLLTTLASPAFKKAYERVCSIWDARDELDKLKRSIQTIHEVLLDAEKKHDSSASIKDWIKRVKDVLYDADDLFDEVATDDMIKQQIDRGNNILRKVRVSCSKLNPIVSRDSIAKKVKAIRKSLLEISTDMVSFQFVICQREAPVSGFRKGQDPGCFVDSNNIIGRDKDKKGILEMLFNESDSARPGVPFVISIVGIGGMGKTTLAQLVYNHEEVGNRFEKRWFACISDTSDEKEVLGKIFQSVCNENYSKFSVGQLQTNIRESMKAIKSFLLVLDDVWDEDHGRWQHRMSLLSNCSKGSKIIVTTRSLSVARAVGSLETHNLRGLSDEESWDLFKRIAFTPEQERDSTWTDLGRKIVKKCANVPLAIRSIGSLLYTKTTILEWESFKDEELSKVEEQSGDSIMNVLKLSYEHLPSNLKHCFAYCSLFPKDYIFDARELIYLWIAQGYIKPHHKSQTVEQAGYSDFMNLFRRSFFQEAECIMHDEISWCKMHDLVHDLAQCVAGEEICVLRRSSDQFHDTTRHAGVVCKMDSSWEGFSRPLNINRVRSILIDLDYFGFHLNVDDQLTKFKCLRTLSLKRLGIESVSSSIGELKHLRYVNLSHNKFVSLPDSLTNLLNLVVLNVSWCDNLRVLPDKLRKVINLRHLNIDQCRELKHMPPGFEELTCLQYLTNFEVGKASEGVQMSGLNAFVGLMQQLRGQLCIRFHMDPADWDGDESWQLPSSPQILTIEKYPGSRIPQWGNGSEIVDTFLLSNLASLRLYDCLEVKYLPTISLLPNLKSLYLSHLGELEYLEEEDEDERKHKKSCITVASESSTNASTFFPRLEALGLTDMPKLKGWRRRQEAHPHEDQLVLPSLSRAEIATCPQLKYMPLCPRLRSLLLLRNVGMQLLMSVVGSNSSSLENISIFECNGITSFTDETLTSLRYLEIQNCVDLSSLHLISPHLQKISIDGCIGLMRFQVQALPTLLSLQITRCIRLKNLYIAHLNALDKLKIISCPELKLWDQFSALDWDSLPNLRKLVVDTLSPLEKLPESLLCRQALGKFHFTALDSSFDQ